MLSVTTNNDKCSIDCNLDCVYWFAETLPTAVLYPAPPTQDRRLFVRCGVVTHHTVTAILACAQRQVYKH